VATNVLICFYFKLTEKCCVFQSTSEGLQGCLDWKTR